MMDKGTHEEQEMKATAMVPTQTGDDARNKVFAQVIERAKLREPHNAVTMTRECFVRLWNDGQTVCDEAGCTLRSQCKSGYEEALVQLTAKPAQPAPVAKKAPAVLLKTVKAIKQDVKQPRKRPMPPKAGKPRKRSEEPQVMRGKWRGTGKFQRLGYQKLNRPVDDALNAFLGGLQESCGHKDIPLPMLPRVWSPIGFDQKYGQNGPLMMSQTASYTTIYYRGNVVVRFWVNAGGCATIDIIDTLVNAVKSIQGIGEIKPAEPGTLRKIRPCTYQIKLALGGGSRSDVLKTLGSWIGMMYRNG
jgi:hypothetical protein